MSHGPSLTFDWGVGDTRELNVVPSPGKVHRLVEDNVEEDVAQICFGPDYHLSFVVHLLQMEHTKPLISKLLAFLVKQFAPEKSSPNVKGPILINR